MNVNNAQAILDSYVAKGIPGCSMTVYKDHKEIFRAKSGYADAEAGREMSFDALANIYSCSKVITCTAALTLVAAGKMRLDDALGEYIPEFAKMNVRVHLPNGESVIRPTSRQIKISDLFTMSAGLDYDLNSEAIRRVREKTDGRCPTLEIVKALADRPLCFEPGAQFRYSLCHDVIGALIEVVSGMSFGEYLKRTIFDPLEMNDTGFVIGSEKAPRMMAQYRYDPELGKAVNIGPKCAYKLGSEYESGGAGLISSLEDYGKFVDMLACEGVGANGARIISRGFIDVMRAPKFVINHPGYRYALGVMVHTDRSESLMPSPLGEFAWSGAAGSQMLIDPENHISMFYMQHMLATPLPVRDRLVNVVYS